MEIQYTPTPTSQEINFLIQQLNATNPTCEPMRTFGFFVKNSEGEIIAGASGTILFGGIYTEQLWVHPNYRKQGWGKKVMEKVHVHGKSMGCKMATLATMNFQGALEFYNKLGYQIDFQREGYEKEGICLFLRKDL
jgi:ribosomal protein S18 acetylase RimI-like enzyme